MLDSRRAVQAKTKPDILCFSSSDWDGKWGSRQQVMERLVQRGFRVLFVERMVGWEHLLRHPDIRRRKIRRWHEGLRRIQDNLWILSIPPLLAGRYYSLAVAHFNTRLAGLFVRPQMARLGLCSPIVWVYRPEDGGLFGRFCEQMTVYHCIDEFSAGTQGRKRRVISELEQETLLHADIVFANSTATRDKKRAYNPNTFLIPSGADTEHFSQVLDPEVPVHIALANADHPIAGYVGNINRKLDVTLLAAVARILPNWRFIFIGQSYRQDVDLHPLEQLPNVHFAGRFPFADIPSLLKGVDVCLLPYADTEYARFRSPLKLYEYLAAGKPIVSTDHPEVRDFAEWVKIAATPTEFAAAIEQAYHHDTTEMHEERARAAQQHSWDRRVDLMEKVLLEYLRKGHGATDLESL